MLPAATPQRGKGNLWSTRKFNINERQSFTALDMRNTERTVIVDVDVLQADAGTRTTAITGGFAARCYRKLVRQGALERSPIRYRTAGFGGIIRAAFFDLNYVEDVAAQLLILML